MILINENNDAIDTLKIRTSDSEIRDNILKDSQFAHASVVMRRDALEEVGLYDPDWNMVEDYELWMRIGTRYNFTNLSDLFLSYRINPNGVSTKNAFKQKIMSLRLTYKYKNVYPSFFLALALKIPYTILPKSVSSFFLKLIKK